MALRIPDYVKKHTTSDGKTLYYGEFTRNGQIVRSPLMGCAEDVCDWKVREENHYLNSLPSSMEAYQRKRRNHSQG